MPCVAVNVSQATIPEVVVIVLVVLSTRTGGLIVTEYAWRTIALAESVAVTVSVKVRNVVELVALMEFERLRVKAFAVEVSSDTPVFKPVTVKILFPVPPEAVEPDSDAAMPWVVIKVVAGVEIVGKELTVTVIVSLAVAPTESVAVITML